MNNVITRDKFDFEWFTSIPVLARKAGNQGGKRKIKYKDIVTAFDIETSRVVAIEQSVLYLWQYQFGNVCTVIGRTLSEFMDFTRQLALCMADGIYLCTYVHNLSYEFQFLKGVYDFSIEEVFALDRRKVLKAEMLGHIELRCSYMHSNMSLAEYTSKMGAEHAKKSSEEFDHTKERYPWTELTDLEMEYAVNDVLGLVEALTIEMKYDGDNLYTIPSTSTGYVRRDCKAAMRNVSHTFVKKQLPDYETYRLCREAFRGGNTHANRYYTGTIVKGVKSADRSSSYPDVLCNCEFPVSEFFYAGNVTYESLVELINVRKKAVLMRVAITNIRLTDQFFGAPYLSRDKCRNIRGGVYDNGRILEAEYIETTITDIDFKILLSQYSFDDLRPFDVRHARYGKLPPVLLEVIVKYYELKTELKNVDGEELQYLKSKNKINAIYGMMAQDPVKQTIDYIEGEFVERQDSPIEILESNKAKAFLCYQWGVWTTAWARYRLEEGIRLAGDGFIYCDTDSVKYIGAIDWTAYNNARIKDSKKTGAHAKDKHGNIFYMGVFESETEKLPNGEYHEFSTLGAKKYCYRERPTDKLHITIAGVSKIDGAKELDAAGGISAFKEDFIFYKGGGLEAVYNDNPPMKTYSVDGKQLDISSNVVLRPSTYTLGVTAEYKQIFLLAQKKMLTFMAQ